MKKLLGSTLSLAMVFSYSPASAEVLKNFKLSGSIEVNSTSANNVSDLRTNVNQATGATGRDNLGDTQTRVLLHADWDLLDDVHAKITLLKNNRIHGTGSEHLNTVQTNITIEQSYFKIDKVADAVDMTVGRQFYNEGNSRNEMVAFWGPLDKSFAMPVTTLDAFRFDWGNDQWGLTGLAGRTADPNAGTSPDASTDVRGLIATIKGNEQWNAGAYVWNRVVHRVGAAVGTPPSDTTAGGKNDFLWVAGLKGKVTMEGAWVALEYAKNFGQNRAQGTAMAAPAFAPATRSYTGWAVKLDAGYKAELSGLGTLNPWLHWGFGSGDGSPNDARNSNFTPIASDYRPGAIYGRFHANNGMVNAQLGNAIAGGNLSSGSLTDRNIMGIGLKATPEAVNKLTAGLSVYDYSFAARPGHAYVRGSGNRHIGSEVDVDAEWKHSENVTLGVTLGKFQPGGFVNEAQQSNDNGNVLAGTGTGRSGTGVNAAYLAAFDVKVKF